MARMPKETRLKIAATVKQRWAEGVYKEHGHKVRLAHAHKIATAAKNEERDAE
jgi:hypothetical protein